MVNTQIQTATTIRENVNKQMFINLRKEALNIDFAVVIVKKLMYDMILGMAILKVINARLNIVKQKLLCTYNGQIIPLH
jgi:hypothetical protein